MKKLRRKKDEIPEVGTFRYGFMMKQSRADFTQDLYERMKRKREEKRKKKLEKRRLKE